MLSTLMVLSLDQGKLATSRRSIGQFDARLLDDIGYEPNSPAWMGATISERSHAPLSPSWTAVRRRVGDRLSSFLSWAGMADRIVNSVE
jgi:hypothetical protein